MIEFIFGALIMGVGIYLGYVMGKGSSIIPEETQKQVKRLIQNLPIKHDLGAVSAPTAQQVDDWNNPLVQAEKEEMSKTFSEIVPKQ
jgi:hypothetical protein